MPAFFGDVTSVVLTPLPRWHHDGEGNVSAVSWCQQCWARRLFPGVLIFPPAWITVPSSQGSFGDAMQPSSWPDTPPCRIVIYRPERIVLPSTVAHACRKVLLQGDIFRGIASDHRDKSADHSVCQQQYFSRVIKLTKKPGIFPIQAITTNSIEAHIVGTGIGNYLKGKLMFGVEDNMFLRHLSLQASSWIIGPNFRKVQPIIYRGSIFIPAKNSKNVDLAVIVFCELAAPLATYSHRHFLFFGYSGFVDI